MKHEREGDNVIMSGENSQLEKAKKIIELLITQIKFTSSLAIFEKNDNSIVLNKAEKWLKDCE